MISVRWKLFALVAGSFIPAIIGAVVNQREGERKLLSAAAQHIEEIGQTFDESMDDYQKDSRIALTFATESPWLARALAEENVERTTRFVERLSEVYKYRSIVAVNENGATIAASKPKKGGPTVNAHPTSATGQLLRGELLFGLVPVTVTDDRGQQSTTYALVTGTPIFHEEKRVGSVALFSFVTARYVEYLKRNLGADLSISVNGSPIASTAGHPAPHLQGSTQNVTFQEDQKRLLAVQSFLPKALQREGFRVEVTASRDVTKLRSAARADLRHHLLLLGLASLVVLALALRFASRLAQSISKIADAARSIKSGNYVQAPVISTGDELESLARDFNGMTEGLRERDRLKETFGRYVTRQVADHLMKGEQNLGGELVPVTVLFSDIRSFTSISEKMDPRELLDFLNEYFSGMVESVLSHQGVVDKFIGDAIMAVFGAPVPEPEDPLRAIRAALAMRERLEKINQGFHARGLPEIRAGIGLHSGQVIAGNMGHSERMEYTVIGDTVNLASRLEGLTKELDSDVIVSEDLYKQVQDDVVVDPLRKIRVKGRDQEVMVYRLVGLAAEMPKRGESRTKTGQAIASTESVE